MAKKRDIIKNKFNGLCAYSGTPLEDDWQVDHIKPKIMYYIGSCPYQGNPNDIDNLIPAQRIINHYKRSLPLEKFKSWYLGGLHLRLKKLPKNPKTELAKKRKEYLLKIASYFDITEDKPFSGKFYFETIQDKL